MPVSAAHLTVVAIATVLITWGFWRWFWQRYSNPPRRTSAWAGFILFLYSIFPALWVAEALATGNIRCIGRRCGDITYSAATDPVSFWVSTAVLGVLGVFGLSGALFAAFKALAPSRVAA
jgi:hypothetical protein